MSSKERDRLALFSQVRDGHMALCEASRLLGVSYRQVKRSWRRYRELGDAGLVHRLRGRPSNNTAAADARREIALSLYVEHYQGFGPTLAAEMLSERDGLVVDHETLRRWLTSARLWKAKKQPKRSYRRRPRRPCFGELVQFDGSDHAWFGAEHVNCTLMVMIDDATGLVYARFFESETTHAAMEVFKAWTLRYGLPRALYPDCAGIHRRNDKEADEIEHRTGKRPPTRFGAAMEELGVELIWARSPQAKGRVERMNQTLQDRLVKMLALDGITDMESANRYLEEMFLPRHNARFAVEAADAVDAHRPTPTMEELDAALCPVCERRVVDKSGCVSWRGRCFELTGKDAAPRRRHQVWVRERLDGRVELVTLEGERVLSSRELKERPKAQAAVKPSLAERVAGHVGPMKPAAEHPWRKGSLAAAGCASSRCARLRCAGRSDPGQPPTKGTVLLS